MYPRVGLALGGGVARGIAHIGVLQVLAEYGIPVQIICGTSAGSLVGAMYAAGLSPGALEQAAKALDWRKLVKLQLRRDGLLDASGLEKFMSKYIGDIQFTGLGLPFAAVACDLVTGEEVVLRHGPVATAVRASCAYPGIFLPVQLGQHYLVDGGLVNNVPSRTCRQLGADFVIAVELNNRHRALRRPPRNLLQIILNSLAVVQGPQVQGCLANADVVIQPRLEQFGIFELDRVTELVAAGRWAAQQAMPTILLGMGQPRAEKVQLPATGSSPS